MPLVEVPDKLLRTVSLDHSGPIRKDLVVNLVDPLCKSLVIVQITAKAAPDRIDPKL